MLMTSFSKNCLIFTALATSLISSRVVAQEVSPPISPPLLVAKIDSPMVGAIPFLDLATIAPVSAISATNPWLSNNRLLARADLLYWRSLSLFRNQNFRLLNSQNSATNLLAESVSPVGVDLSGLNPIASDSLVAQAIAETEEVISDSVPVTEVSQTNGANPEDVMPVVPTETPVPDAEIPAPPATPAVQESSQDADELIQRIRNSLVITGRSGRTITPALTVTTPIGFGGYYGSASIGVGYQSQSGPGEGTGDDAGAAVAISLGNPKDYVGFDLIWNIQGLSNTTNAPNNFGDGTLSLQLSRLLTNDWSLGFGMENFVRFSGRNGGNVQNYYLVTTKYFALDEDTSKPFSVLYTSIGLGTGRFLPAGNFNLYGGDGVNVFGSAAIQVIEGVNGIVEWSGQDLNLGISLAPFANFPLIITPGVVNLTKNNNGGAAFVITTSLGIFF